MSQAESIFVPLPDPARPHTLNQANIKRLRKWGLFGGGEDGIAVFASRADYGIRGTGTFPEDGDTPKYWRDNSLLNRSDVTSKLYVFITDRRLPITRKPTDTAYSDPTFEIYRQSITNLYRTYAPLFSKWGGVPVLEWRTVSRDEAVRFNVAEGTPEEYPLAQMLDSMTDTFPDNVGLRVNPDTGDVEAFLGDAFVQQFGDGARYGENSGEPQTITVAATIPAPVVKPSTPPASTVAAPIAERESRLQAVSAHLRAAEAIETHEGMDIDTGNGEAICNGVRTGWHFLLPAQALPSGGENLDTNRVATRISPWGFASRATAERLRGLLQPMMQDAGLSVVAGDQNSQFPYSTLQLYISAGGSAKINAGLLASEIARTTFFDTVNKRVVQTDREALAGAVLSLQAELASQRRQLE